MQKCSNIKVPAKENETIICEHKTFFEELLNKYKSSMQIKNSDIKNLENENNLLRRENELKQTTITNYNNYINEYNHSSWIKKLKNIF